MEKKDLLSITYNAILPVDGGQKGYKESLCNLVSENIIYSMITVESTKIRHLFTEPSYEIVDNKNDILQKINKIDFNKLELMSTNDEEVIRNNKYYEFETISGTNIKILESKLSEKDNELLQDLFNNLKISGKTSEKFIMDAPILDYTNSKIEFQNEINTMKSIAKSISNKNKDFYTFIDKNVACITNHREYKGRRKLKKYVNSITGIFNFGIMGVGSHICGYINEKYESDVILEIDYYSKKEKSWITKYAKININSDNQVIQIRLYNENQIVAKQLNDKAINFVINHIYDDLNDEIVSETLKENKTWQEYLSSTFSNNGTKTTFNNLNIKK